LRSRLHLGGSKQGTVKGCKAGLVAFSSGRRVLGRVGVQSGPQAGRIK
jgi:hypothetical protein